MSQPRVGLGFRKEIEENSRERVELKGEIKQKQRE